MATLNDALNSLISGLNLDTFDLRNELVISDPNGNIVARMKLSEISNVSSNIVNSAIQEVLDEITDVEADMELLRQEVNAAQLEIGAVQTDPVPTENSTNHLTSGAVYTALQKVTDKEITFSGTPVVIAPNNLYKLGARSTLNVSFEAGESGVINEYKFEFTVSSNSFALTLPVGVIWAETPEWVNGYTYQVSVIDNLALYAGWEAAQEE